MKVWSLRVDTDTGKLCFFNKISGKILFQKPVGLKVEWNKVNFLLKIDVFLIKLTAKEKEIWETQNNHPESSDGLFGPAISKLTLAGNVGQWEEVNPAEDYFEKNAYISEDDDSSDLDPELKKIEEKLEESSQKLEENLKFWKKNQIKRKKIMKI